MRKILLNKSKSKERVNNDNNISISFDRDISLFNNEVLSETIDVLQQYNNEKNNSNKHRFIFTLTPICTNSLLTGSRFLISFLQQICIENLLHVRSNISI